MKDKKMRACIIFITLLFIVTANADENWFPVGKSGATTIYINNEAECNAVESPDKCFNVSGKNIRRWKVVDGSLVPDSEGEDAVDLEAAEKLSKEAKRTSRLNTIEACARTKLADFTVALQRSCLRLLARELIRERLKSTEM